jgi:hypothetical protein
MDGVATPRPDALAELPKRFWNHAMPGYALNESHPQCSGLAASQALGAHRRLMDLLKNTSRIFQEGISDAPAWWTAQANTLAFLRGWSPFVGLQIEYNLVERTVERELIPMAGALNLG